MNADTIDPDLQTPKFGIGQPVRRLEDADLLRGMGQYSDDARYDGALFARILRSPYAHGLLKSIDADAARAMPGVAAVYTGADLPYEGNRSILPFKSVDGTGQIKPPHPPLARDRVLYAGQPIAFVVAQSYAQARDAVEAIEIDVETLPAVTTAAAGMTAGAPQLHGAMMPSNVSLDYGFGPMDDVEAALATAHQVTKLDVVSNRVVVNAMEPRSAQAIYDDGAGRWTLHAQGQGVMGLAARLAGVIGEDPRSIRCLSVHVGGSFGMKGDAYAEFTCLLHAARDLNRPVRWADDRSESFLSDYHGRDTAMTAELGLDAHGRFLALKVTGTGNIGAYPTGFGAYIASQGVAMHLVSVYKTPLIATRTQCVCTNTTPIGPYRGAGRPEGNYVVERVIEAAARQMGIDAVELRRRNLIPATAIPYEGPNGHVYDSGNFPAILEKTLEVSSWNSFAGRKADAKSRGKLLGRGLGLYLENTAPASGEQADIRFGEDGAVSVYSGTHDQGQGHRTAFAQVVSTYLGVAESKVRIVQYDSDKLQVGSGTGGSKSILNSGTAIAGAAEKLIDKGKHFAGHILEAAAGDVEFAVTPGEGGRFTVAGTDLHIGLVELAARVAAGEVPAGTNPQDASLDTLHLIDPHASTYPNGGHVAEVEIDPETGVTQVVRYDMVNDFGTVVNPMIVEAQAHGGVLQGIGQALMEDAVYDDDGQLLTGSYMDYAMPHARDLPEFTICDAPSPATTNPLGVKGCGEAGCAGSLSAVMNAIVDALSEFGVTNMDMPATPEKVWRAINGTAARD